MIGNSARTNEFSRRHWRPSSVPAFSRSRARRERIAKVQVREDLQVESATARQVESQERLFRLYGSALTSFLASQGIGCQDGERIFQERARAFLASRCEKTLGIDFEGWIAQVVAVKVKCYNAGASILSETQESETSDAVDRRATDYFKASRGN